MGAYKIAKHTEEGEFYEFRICDRYRMIDGCLWPAIIFGKTLHGYCGFNKPYLHMVDIPICPN